MKTLNQSPYWLVIAIVFLGVVAISTGSIFVRLAIDAAGVRGVGFSLLISASRLSIAALLLTPTWGRVSWRTYKLEGIFYAIAAGICLASHFAVWITSLSYTSIAASTTIVTTSSIWVAVLSWLWWRERPGKATILGMMIALSGGMIIGLADAKLPTVASNPIAGNILALIGAITAALYLMLGREAQQRGLSLSAYIAIAYTIGAMILLPLPLLWGVKYTGHSATVYFYLILMGLVPQLIGHTSFNWAVNRTSPTLVTLAILLEPVGASFLGYLLFGEVPSTQLILGAIVILTGVAIATIANNASKTQSSSQKTANP